jgi:pimeloyl-ACP methyl ester carboxylesterase
VVGLHGWSGDHKTFDPLLPHLSPETTFFAVDLPGCGKSPEPKVWEMKSLGHDLAKVLIALDHVHLTLAGNCSGALLALFAIRELREMGRGDVVGRLVMIDPFAYCPWYLEIFVHPALGPLGWWIYAATFANPIGRSLLNLCLRGMRTKDTHLTETFAEVNQRTTWRLLKVMYECGPASTFQGLPIPVEIMAGENSFAVVVKSLKIWKKVLPQVVVHVLPGTCHLPIEEDPKSVAKILFRVPNKVPIPKTKKLSSQSARQLREERNEMTRGD